MKHKLLIYISLIICFSLAFAKINENEISISNTGARYVTGPDGTLRMYVNIWGHIPSPGRILVDEGIDLATLLSLSGGPMKGANLKKIKVYHEYPDSDGKMVHIINFSNFLNSGDRTNFIDIQPNDTFIIEQTSWSFFIGQIGTINTLMNLLNLYLNFQNFIQ